MMKNSRVFAAALAAAAITIYATAAAQAADNTSFKKALADLKAHAYPAAQSELKALAAKGHAGAQFQLGLMAHLGQGIPQNYGEARQWYERAARGGEIRAQNNLGVLYRDGLGVPVDKVQAYKWFSLASSKRNKQAIDNLRALRHDLKKDDIARGQRLAQVYHDDVTSTGKPVAAPKVEKVAAAGTPAAPVNAAPKAAPIQVKVAAKPEPAPKLAAKEEPTKRAAPAAKPTSKSEDTDVLAALKALVMPAVPAKPAEPTQPAVARKAPVPPKAAIDRREYFVQLGLFRNPSNVGRIRDNLRKEKLELVVERIELGGRTYQRLRLGPFTDKAAAKVLARRMDDLLHIRSLVLLSSAGAQAEAEGNAKRHL